MYSKGSLSSLLAIKRIALFKQRFWFTRNRQNCVRYGKFLNKNRQNVNFFKQTVSV